MGASHGTGKFGLFLCKKYYTSILLIERILSTFREASFETPDISENQRSFIAIAYWDTLKTLETGCKMIHPDHMSLNWMKHP